MARAPRLSTARAGLLGGSSSGPRMSNANASMIERGGQSVAGGIQSVAEAQLRIDQNRAAAYVAEKQPEVELRMQQLLLEQQQNITADNVDSFVAVYTESIDSMLADAIEQTPARGQRQMRAAMARARARNVGAALQIEARRGIELRTEQFMRGAETAGAILETRPEHYGEHLQTQLEAIDGLMVPDAQKDRLREVTTGMLTESHIRGLIDLSPETALAALEAGSYDERLTPDRKRVLVNTARQRGSAMTNQARRELAGMLNSIEDAVLDGVAPPMSIADWREQAAGLGVTAGPEVEQAALLDAVSQQTREMRMTGFTPASRQAAQERGLNLERIPPAVAISQTVDVLEAQRRREGASRGLDMLLTAARNIEAQVVERAKNNPILGAYEAGVIDEMPDLDPMNPVLSVERMAAMEAATSYFGRPVSPFNKDEAIRIRETMAQMPPDQRAEHVVRMVSQLPPQYADRVAEQLGDGDAAMGAAVAMAVRGKTELVDRIFRGQSVMDSEGFQLSKDDFLASVPVDYVQALGASPGAYELFYQAAMALYSGRTDVDVFSPSAAVDSGAFQETWDELTGGLVSHNGRMTVAPVEKMTQDDFRAALYRMEQVDIARYGRQRMPDGSFMPVEDVPGSTGMARAPGDGTTAPQLLTPEMVLRDTQFIPAAEGMYYVVMGDSTIQTGPEGQPYVFDMRSYLKSLQYTPLAGVSREPTEEEVLGSILRGDWLED